MSELSSAGCITQYYLVLLCIPARLGTMTYLRAKLHVLSCTSNMYRIIQNDCRGFNNFSYTIHLRQEYIVAPVDKEILNVFFYDVRCAVVMHFSRN